MYKKTKALMAVAMMSVIALAGGYAQTPAPDPNAGTYHDKTLSTAQRIELAWTAWTEGGDAQAAQQLLALRPVVPLLNTHPEFADDVLADPTLGGKVPDNRLWAAAVLWKAETILPLDDKIAWLAQHLDSAIPGPAHQARLRDRYGYYVARAAQVKLDAGDIKGAIDLALPVAGYSPVAVNLIYRAKLAQRAPDALNWAKLVYVIAPFRQTQGGIDAVSSALRSMDGHLARANEFIEYQKTGVGEDPLKDVTLPQVELLGYGPEFEARKLGVGGDPVAALKLAVGVFATAPSGPRLNAATALVAQWLRNIDGNLVRANAFVETQSKGEPFVIAEIAP